MTKLKKKINFIILTIILVSYFVIPFIGIQLVNSDSYNQNQKSILNLESLTSSLETHVNSNDINQEISSNFQSSKFDENLNKFLTNLNKNPESNPKDINVIISFEESLPKEERIDILDSVFDNYELKKNYDIISSTHIIINPNQLIKKNYVIEGIKSIREIHESKYYQLPYIKDDSVQLSALNSDDYSNWWLSAIGADNLSYNGSGVKVAVIDTGIYPHPDLDIINNSNFVANESLLDYNDVTGHGTHVAGIIAGDGIGSSGEYRGVAPGVLLINARAGNESGLAETDIISAIEWSSKPTSSGGAGADIISMSFGGGYPILSDNITKAISTAKNDYGVIFVSSAGNSGPAFFTGSTPASGIDVISVGATNKNGNLASFSSWGPTFGYIGYPDVVAPGVNIISTDAKDSTFSKEERYKNNYFDFAGDADYIPLSGTSFSCPMVAGALAIILEACPYITPETARIALLEGARTFTDGNENIPLKSGAGMINVTASLNYLKDVSPNYNDTAKIYPDDLPVKPYDLLNFPGDHQKFNLTVISGDSNTFDIEIPDYIQGISLSIDKTSITFSEPGIGFLELEIKIEKNAFAEIKSFQINLTSGGQIYDTADITLDIRLPEYRILMESYHGLNDWFADQYIGYTFYQMGFYEAMNDLSNLNISIDYSMEYWTPDYNRDFNNSILTEERLAQYDIVVLQNPILPYSPTEIDNLENYFNRGGNLLFLGTRYQDMVVENVNYLFSRLNVSIQINEENIMDDKWLGIGASVSSQSVYHLNNSVIFNNVSQFYWLHGNSFTVSNNADSIAYIDNKTVAALYNGTEHARGNILAFGDLHWIYDQYDSTSYTLDHSNLLKNIISFFLPSDEVSITFDLGKESTSNSEIDISIYMKNQTSESPITDIDYTSLSVIIKNGIYQESIILNTTNESEGIYFNNSFNLPTPSNTLYTIIIDLTIGSKEFNKTTKILYYDSNEMPEISEISLNDSPITRANNQLKLIITELDSATYNEFEGYLSIYSYSFYNTKKSVNKTLTFSLNLDNDYIGTFYPEETDPSGYAIFYVVPKNSNYTTSNSPRILFQIENNPPKILKESSNFDYDYFDDTESDEASKVYPVDQGETLNFAVDVRDTVPYEDTKSNMRVFVNLFITVVKEDGHILVIFPDTIEVAELNYQSSSDKYEGNFTIPNTMEYSTISGIKSVSTATNFDSSSNTGYLGVLIITAYDSEGGYDEFIIVLLISGQPIDFSFLIIIIFIVIGIIGFAGMLIYFTKRKTRPKISQYQPRYQDYYYEPSYEKTEGTYVTPEPLSHLEQFYCPFCGQFVANPKKFCPSCGESLTFNETNE
ncbi:MAG: S8 family serine peptidase [Candidatus Lokiarchaeota archaeon]|nr:S8 family serine peptidase [Candidatus Lokiarchaeota archaeon]